MHCNVKDIKFIDNLCKVTVILMWGRGYMVRGWVDVQKDVREQTTAHVRVLLDKRQIPHTDSADLAD